MRSIRHTLWSTRALTLVVGMFYLRHQDGSAGATTLSALQSSGAAVGKAIVVLTLWLCNLDLVVVAYYVVDF